MTGNGLFKETKLPVATVPSSIKTFGQNVFYLCEQLTKVILESGLQSIGDFMFTYAKSLQDLTVPVTVTYIGLIYIYTYISSYIVNLFF